MENFNKLIASFNLFVPFSHSLRAMTAEQWSSPFKPGKWPVSGIIGHIMLWDRHFMKEAIGPIVSGSPLTLKYPDFDAFNAEAAAYAAAIEQNELIDACIAQRQQLIVLLESLTPEQREAAYSDGDGNPFTVLQYLEDFIGHDLHHRQQIEQFLSA